MTLRLEQATQRREIVAHLPDPPAQIKLGIEAFYQQTDPDKTHRVEVNGMEIYGWQDSLLHTEATVKLSWQDYQHFQDPIYDTKTILGTLLSFGCASLDEATGKITVTETVPEKQENRKAKQDVINYILAHKDAEGYWVIGGIKRRKTADMVFSVGTLKQ